MDETSEEEYINSWKQWRAERMKDVNRPYGWLSVVCQEWLPEGEPFVCDYVPGTWLLEGEDLLYTPDPKHSDEGEFLLINGKPAIGPTVIQQGLNKNSGTGSAVDMFFGHKEVETITRLNSRGEVIRAVRVRDPKVAASKRIDAIETYPASLDWVVPARFTPVEKLEHTVETVESGIFETNYTIGKMHIDVHGNPYMISVFGHRGGSPEEGYVVDLTYIHIGDLTSGTETYGGGRVVILDPESLAQTNTLDLNKLVSFPCALSSFIACPAIPASERLNIRVTAGELTPPGPHERIKTYKE